MREWKIVAYPEDKLVVTEKSKDYSPEEIYSEFYPVGLYEAAVIGIKKGEGIETATQMYLANFYVDENNKLTLVTEDDAMFLINK